MASKAVTYYPERRILVIGKTGHGKSSTANTILGHDVFEVSYFDESQTCHCTYGSAVRMGKKLIVIDTPGMFDTRRPNEKVQEELIRACAFLSPGFHAIVFVLKAGERFTRENEETVYIYERLFGKELWKYTFLVLSNGDELERKAVSFTDYLEKSSESLKKLRQLCEERCFMINNIGASLDKNNQVNLLIDAIEKNTERLGGHCFSNMIFKGIQYVLYYKLKNVKPPENDIEMQALLAASDTIPDEEYQSSSDNFREEMKYNGHKIDSSFCRIIKHFLKRFFERLFK